MKLTDNEWRAWGNVQRATYPQWRKVPTGFLLYLGPNGWTEEVFRRWDGTWLAGCIAEGTARVFDRLSDAFAYGERLTWSRLLEEVESRFDADAGRELLPGECSSGCLERVPA